MQDIFFSQRTTLPTRTPDVLDRNYALLQQAEGYVYKTVSGIDLGAYVFRPRTEAPPAGWPVALFFFSSTWDNGLVSQFAPHAMYLASRGMAGILIDYRVAARFPGCTPMQAADDARSAVRWTREHAADLGIDPEKIVGCGGSAGAHAILSATLTGESSGPEEGDTSISCSPNLLILFSPILDTGVKGIFFERFPDAQSASLTSPVRCIRRKLPPILIIHGTVDRVVPFEHSLRFKKKSWWRRNVCRLLPYAGQGHGFFNFNFDVRLYELTLNDIDRFLVERGFLADNPDDDGVPRLS